MDDVRIGDFTKPIVTSPPGQAVTKAKLDSAEKKLGGDADEAERTLKPRQSYEERLKEIGVSKEDAASIIDAVLTKGFYSEEIPLTPRIKLKLRTRQLRDTQRAQNYIEIARPTYENHYNEAMARYNLAASLEKLGKDNFDFPDRIATGDQIEELFKVRLNYVDTLAEPTYRLLLQKSWKFDQKVLVVLEEGAIENF